MYVQKSLKIIGTLLAVSVITACVQPMSYQQQREAQQVSSMEAARAFDSIKQSNAQAFSEWNKCLQYWFNINGPSAFDLNRLVESSISLCHGRLSALEKLVENEIRMVNPNAGMRDSLIAAKKSIDDYVISQKPKILADANQVHRSATSKMKDDNDRFQKQSNDYYTAYKKCVFESVVASTENLPSLAIAQTAAIECQPLLNNWQTTRLKQVLSDQIGRMLKLEDAKNIVQKQASQIQNETLSSAVKLRLSIKKGEGSKQAPAIIDMPAPKQMI